MTGSMTYGNSGVPSLREQQQPREPRDRSPWRGTLTLGRNRLQSDYQLGLEQTGGQPVSGVRRPARHPAKKASDRQERIGLFISDFQPVDKRKVEIILRMVQECDYVIVGLGSCNQQDKDPGPYTPLPNHPFSAEVRLEMLKLLFGNTISVVKLRDIAANTIPHWYHYVRSQIHSLGMPDPTDLYVSREASRVWYGHWFNEANAGRRLVVCGGSVTVPPPTEIREMLNLRLDAWKQHVPRRIHDLIERCYPAKFRIPIILDGGFDDNLPNGTHVIRTDMTPAVRYFKEGHRWRRVGEAERLVLLPTG